MSVDIEELLKEIEPFKQTEQISKRDREILHLAQKEKLSYRKIAEILGTSPSTIRIAAKRLGLDAKILISARTKPRATVRICPMCGEEYKISESKLHRKAGAHQGIKVSDSNKTRAFAIADDYLAGMKAKDIQTKYNLPPPSIYRALRYAKVKIDRTTVNRAPTMEQTYERQAAIIRDIKAQIPFEKIADKHSVSVRYVDILRKKVNV